MSLKKMMILFQKLNIDSTFSASPARLVNLLDFKPEKLSIETESNTNNDLKVYYLRYEHGGFYLVIDDIEGYFEFSHNLGHLNLFFDDDDNKQNKYYQVWKEILKTINGGHGKIRSRKEIRLFNNELPIGYVFKINSITIVMESLIEKNNIFYPEIALNHCSNEIK